MAADSLRYEPKVVVDYMCPNRPQVTDLRGSLVVGALRLLKDGEHFERYMAMVPPERRDVVNFSLASSWITSEIAHGFFSSIDNLQLSDSQIAKMGERLGTHILDNLFATLVRSARSAGADTGVWFVMRQCERVWSRVYQGGGCTLIQTGPKDAILEVHGVPFAESRCFRMMHGAFMRGMVQMVARTCIAKPARAREPRPDRYAISLSWV
jgi:hypothetical protein